MAKLSGFCLSALLIVLCLRINVYCYPNAFRDDASSPTSAASRTASENERETSRQNVSESKSESSETRPADENQRSAGESDEKSTNDDAKSQPSEPSQPSEQPVEQPNDGAPTDETIVAEAQNADVFKGAKGLAFPPRASLEPASATREVSDEISAPTGGGVPASLKKTTNDAATPETLQAPATGASPTAESSKTSLSSKPQGGKYVSIPSVRTDALVPSANDGDCRVVEATRAARTTRVPKSDADANADAR